jgi:hypothetical protein
MIKMIIKTLQNEIKLILKYVLKHSSNELK